MTTKRDQAQVAPLRCRRTSCFCTGPRDPSGAGLPQARPSAVHVTREQRTAQDIPPSIGRVGLPQLHRRYRGFAQCEKAVHHRGDPCHHVAVQAIARQHQHHHYSTGPRSPQSAAYYRERRRRAVEGKGSGPSAARRANAIVVERWGRSHFPSGCALGH